MNEDMFIFSTIITGVYTFCSISVVVIWSVYLHRKQRRKYKRTDV